MGFSRHTRSPSPFVKSLLIAPSGNYLLLVDYTGRLLREGKASISRELSALFDRLGSGSETWQTRLMKLREGRLLGRFLASTRERLLETATQSGVRHMDNLASCPAR